MSLKNIYFGKIFLTHVFKKKQYNLKLLMQTNSKQYFKLITDVRNCCQCDQYYQPQRTNFQFLFLLNLKRK